ncbi:unnamed protein product [Angiostrongylus costaricensis]|uniref:Uncharacterized protein n=1 Tax=Angiostrongylus costaricensis TaxID=334426 RepID=A0A0R3PEY4_ANGCS|nr:unnamed protein product [Angiostrongylus costaricensis]
MVLVVMAKLQYIRVYSKTLRRSQKNGRDTLAKVCYP